MEFVSNNITLSGLTMADEDDIVAYMQDREILDATRIPFPYTREHARQWIEDNLAFEEGQGFKRNYAIRNEAGKMLGCIGLHFNYGYHAGKSEIGYWLGKPHRNKGIMTVAIKKLMAIAVETYKLKSMEAKVLPFNVASQKVLLHTGFIVDEQTTCNNTGEQTPATIKYIRYL